MSLYFPMRLSHMQNYAAGRIPHIHVHSAGNCSDLLLFYKFFYFSINCIVVTSNIPASVRRSSGMTVSAIKESVMKGSTPSDTPMLRAFCTISPVFFCTASARSTLIRPPMARGSSSTTFPPEAITYPPWIRSSSRTAHRISRSLSPAAMMLWESWEMVVAMAPDWIPYPFTGHTPTFPFLPYRSTTASFA